MGSLDQQGLALNLIKNIVLGSTLKSKRDQFDGASTKVGRTNIFHMVRPLGVANIFVVALAKD